MDICSQSFCVPKNVVERCDLYRIIVMAWCSPSNMPLQARLSQNRNMKDMFLEVSDEIPEGFVAAHFEFFPDVFEKVNVACLCYYIGEDIFCCLSDGGVVITRDRDQWVIRVLEFDEELHPPLETLGGGQQTNRKIVRAVVHTIEKRYFVFMPLYFHKLSINDQGATEPFSVAVIMGDLVVVRKPL